MYYLVVNAALVCLYICIFVVARGLCSCTCEVIVTLLYYSVRDKNLFW